MFPSTVPATKPATATVTGIGADGWGGLAPQSRAVLERAAMIIGGPRQLALLPDSVAGRRVPLPSPLLPALEDLIDAHAEAAGLEQRPHVRRRRRLSRQR